MEIHLHISLAGVPRNKRNIVLDMPEGATARQALARYIEENNAPFSFSNMRGIVVLRGGTHAKLDMPLENGDILRLFKPVRFG